MTLPELIEQAKKEMRELTGYNYSGNFLDSFASRIMAEIEKIVPIPEDGAPDRSSYSKGYNDCRSQFLEALKKLQAKEE